MEIVQTFLYSKTGANVQVQIRSDGTIDEVTIIDPFYDNNYRREDQTANPPFPVRPQDIDFLIEALQEVQRRIERLQG